MAASKLTVLHLKRATPRAQGFVRSTTKYWVRNEDVSTVKHHVLQHLPVFQFDKNNFTGDAQVGARRWWWGCGWW